MKPLSITSQEIKPELSKPKVFSRCDVKNAFRHVQLDTKSSYLKTLWSLPMVPYAFQYLSRARVLSTCLERQLEGLKGVRAIADDILVYGAGKTKAETRKSHVKA